MGKEHIAVELTKAARNNSFVDSKIYGGVKIAGSGNKFVRTNIYKFKREHPLLFWIGVSASVVTIVLGIKELILWIM